MAGVKVSAAAAKAKAAEIKREGVLADHVRRASGQLNIHTLAQSYALPAERVRQIVERNGGSYAQ